jgi:hypothetical protein
MEVTLEIRNRHADLYKKAADPPKYCLMEDAAASPDFSDRL